MDTMSGEGKCTFTSSREQHYYLCKVVAANKKCIHQSQSHIGNKRPHAANAIGESKSSKRDRRTHLEPSQSRPVLCLLSSHSSVHPNSFVVSGSLRRGSGRCRPQDRETSQGGQSRRFPPCPSSLRLSNALSSPHGSFKSHNSRTPRHPKKERKKERKRKKVKKNATGPLQS
ncbi:hypothetical protein LX36DRAFT_6683 [Colletotrichum falcatum]|nr:hypothetical protein LX36DRAFT_6683 [Colletotrichum falcatum]